MAKFTSRGARLTALALATGTLVVASTQSAGAVTVPVPDVFGGAANAASIHIEVNLPVEVPGIGKQISQSISLTEGNASKDLNSVLSQATATLGKGILAPLNLVSKSSLSGKTSDSQSLVEIPANPLISGGVGTISSSVAPDNATSALTSTSSSSLASLEIGLGGLLPQLPISADLNKVVDQLQGTVDETQGTLTQTVDSALATLNEVSAGATAPVAAQINQVEATLTSLVDSLQGTLANLAADSALVKLTLLESTNTITRKGSMVEAKATSAIGGLDVLGGLVKLDAVKTESFSSANGVKGAAAADTLTTILGLKVADVLDLKLTDKGLSGTLLGNALPAEAQGAVNTVIESLNSVLNLAGVNIVYGKTTKSVDPAGQSAASASEGVSIVVSPPVITDLLGGLPLLKVQLVPAGTAVNAARLARPAAPRVTPKAPLARTGAELPLFAVIGSGVAGVALVLRRRRAAEMI